MNKDKILDKVKEIIRKNTTNKVMAWGNNIRLREVDNYIDEYYKINNKFPTFEEVKDLKCLKVLSDRNINY